MNGLDLFSGIGGISLALSPWVRTVAYCENDEHACGVLLSRMADNQLCRAPIWDDVRTLRKEDLGNTTIDIISAGFPCQDISSAGTRSGVDGERSGLYREVIRLADSIRPEFIFLENVAAIRARGASDVAKDLAAIGYDSRWTTFEAAAVGAPHRRDRWWLLAYANSRAVWQQPEWQQCEPPERGNAIASNATASGQEAIANADGRGLSINGAIDNHDGGLSFRRDNDGRYSLPSWELESAPSSSFRGMDDGVSDRVERLRSLGNSVVPIAARTAFKKLAGLIR